MILTIESEQRHRRGEFTALTFVEGVRQPRAATVDAMPAGRKTHPGTF